jgi:hypothetical protein
MKRMMKIKAIGHLIGQTVTNINMYLYEYVTLVRLISSPDALTRKQNRF